MKILSLDTETLQHFLNGGDTRKTDHLQVDELHRQLRPPTGIAYSDWQWNHAAINGARLYSVRPNPHPVGMKAGTENLDDKGLGWMEDTERYQQYESYGSPSERGSTVREDMPKITVKKRRLAQSIPRVNFDPATRPYGRY